MLFRSRLQGHILQLQAILQRRNYGNVVVPAAVPYVFTPCFAGNTSTAISYSIGDVLASRANDAPQMSSHGVPSFHVPDRTVPFIIAPEGSPQPVHLDDLGSLIQEFRRSDDLLLRRYGNDLDNSHHELNEQTSSTLAHCANPEPPLDSLYHYRDEWSRIKEDTFSRISAALAPSQNRSVEEVISIAGLWPRITPKSVLRQLARDRVQTLADRWRQAIIRYAIAFLGYQQSQRLLELSLGGRHQERLREVETTIQSNISADPSPDWLLIQVCA